MIKVVVDTETYCSLASETLVMPNGYVEFDNGSQVSHVHMLRLHDTISSGKPKEPSARYNSKLALLELKRIGSLDLQCASPELSLSERHREDHVQCHPVQRRVYIQALSSAYYLGVHFRPFSDRIIDHRNGAEVKDVGGCTEFACDRDGGGVVAAKVVVDVDDEVGLLGLSSVKGIGHKEKGGSG